jgi:hypothetical protein
MRRNGDESGRRFSLAMYLNGFWIKFDTLKAEDRQIPLLNHFDSTISTALTQLASGQSMLN